MHRRATLAACVLGALGIAIVAHAAGATSPGTASRPAHVTVRAAATAVAPRDRMSLGDVTTIDGDEPLASRVRAVDLGAAPMVGTAQRIDAEALRARLRALGFDPAHVEVVGPAQFVITRAFQIVPGTALVDAVKAALLARRADPAANAATLSLVPVQRPDDYRVPTGDITLDARVQEGPTGSIFVAATVTIRVDGRDHRAIPLTFRVGRYQDVLITARQLEPNAVLRASDFRVASWPSTEIAPDAVSELGDVAELEAVRAVPAGQVVTSSMLRRKIVVRRGDVVTLLLETGGLRLTTQGQALEDAHRGDSMRVLNVTSRREVVGKVESGGIVRVPFAQVTVGR